MFSDLFDHPAKQSRGLIKWSLVYEPIIIIPNITRSGNGHKIIIFIASLKERVG